jgi:peptidoglycan/LPS O-acetylase OafA/YrhL
MDIFRDVSWTNLVAHLSFAFGFLPHFSYRLSHPRLDGRTEMQFYVVFPILILLILRFGYLTMAAITLLLTVLSNLLFSPFVNSFPMASFLPMKMHLFVLGMLIAAGFHKRIRISAVCLCVALLPFLPLIEKIRRFNLPWLIGDLAMAVILLLLTCPSGRIRAVLSPVRMVLNAGPMQKLGHISYAVYLVHLLLIPPVIALLLHISWAASLPGKPRFLIFSLAVMTVIVPVSVLLHRFVEQPGIAVGKRLLASRATVPQRTYYPSQKRVIPARVMRDQAQS